MRLRACRRLYQVTVPKSLDGVCKRDIQPWQQIAFMLENSYYNNSYLCLSNMGYSQKYLRQTALSDV